MDIISTRLSHVRQLITAEGGTVYDAPILDSRVRWHVGYKTFRMHPSGPSALYHGGGVYRINTVYEARTYKIVHDGRKEASKGYIPGFHIFPSMAVVEKYLKRYFTQGFRKLEIRQVYYIGTRRKPTNRECMLARFMVVSQLVGVWYPEKREIIY